MQRPKPEIDIVNEVLEDCLLALHHSPFIISLYQQYQQRGSLSKKQLQGLHSKASDSKKIAPSKLATLEALIRKMPTRYKSDIPENTPLYEKNDEVAEMIKTILAKYPQHKQVLFLKSKFDNNEQLSTTEIADLKRFMKVVEKK
jgi:hypothetical protein